jgi:8-oxo-dGTP pyrophosphatase MutT (NUDIX family)
VSDTSAAVAEALGRVAPPVAVHEVAWGPVRIRIAAVIDDSVGLGDGLPVEALGSVRVVVTAPLDGGVGLLLVHGDHAGVLPGGRVEAGEQPVTTAVRELHEETGWTLDPSTLRPLGLLHLRRIDDGPPTPGFPYPDNLMLVLTGTGTPPAEEGWVDTEGQVHRSGLVPADEALAAVATDPIETAFARAVCDLR